MILLIPPAHGLSVPDPAGLVWDVAHDAVHVDALPSWSLAHTAGLAETQVARTMDLGSFERQRAILPRADGGAFIVATAGAAYAEDGPTRTFVVAIGPDGSTEWTRMIVHDIEDSAGGATLAPNGDLLLGLTAYASVGEVNVSVVVDRLTPDGALVWSTSIPVVGTFTGTDDNTPIAVDASGDIVLAVTRDPHVPDGSYLTRLLRLDGAGVLLDDRVIELGGSFTYAHHILAEPEGTLVIGATTQDFVGGHERDGIVDRIDENGNVLASTRIVWGPLDGPGSYSMIQAPDGSFWLATGREHAAGESVMTPFVAGLSDSATGTGDGGVAKLTRALQPVFARVVDAGLQTDLHGLAAAPDGGVLVSGFTRGLESPSGTILTLTPANRIGNDAVVVHVADDGTIAWTRAIGDGVHGTRLMTATVLTLASDGRTIWTAGGAWSRGGHSDLFITREPATSEFAPLTGALGTGLSAVGSI